MQPYYLCTLCIQREFGLIYKILSYVLAFGSRIFQFKTRSVTRAFKLISRSPALVAYLALDVSN